MRETIAKILMIISVALLKTPEPTKRKTTADQRESVPSIPASLSKPFWIIFLGLTVVILADTTVEAVKETKNGFRFSLGHLTTLTTTVTEKSSNHAAGALIAAILLSFVYGQITSIIGGIMGTFLGTFRSSYQTGHYYGGIVTHKILSIFFPNIEEMKRKTLEPYVKMINEAKEEARAEGHAEGIAEGIDMGIAMERERQAKTNGYY